MRTDLGKRVLKIEEQMHVRKWPNRPLTEKEENCLMEFYANPSAFPRVEGAGSNDPACHLTEEEEAELRDYYTKKYREQQTRKEE